MSNKKTFEKVYSGGYVLTLSVSSPDKEKKPS